MRNKIIITRKSITISRDLIGDSEEIAQQLIIDIKKNKILKSVIDDFIWVLCRPNELWNDHEAKRQWEERFRNSSNYLEILEARKNYIAEQGYQIYV